MEQVATASFEETTVAPLTELEELESLYCEMHKDVYGVKARWYRADNVEQARKDLDSLQAAGEVIWAAEKRQQEDNARIFENRVQSIIDMGAKTRENALRWIHDAESTDGDDELLCYRLGLRYGYFKQAA